MLRLFLLQPGGEVPGRQQARWAAPRGAAGASGTGAGRAPPHSSWLTSAGEPRLSGGFSESRALSCSESCSLLGMEFFFGRPLGLVGDSRPPPCNTCEAGRGQRRGNTGETVLPSAWEATNLSPIP